MLFIFATLFLLYSAQSYQHCGPYALTLGDTTFRNKYPLYPSIHFVDIPAGNYDNYTKTITVKLTVLITGVENICYSASLAQNSFSDCFGQSNGGNLTSSWQQALLPEDVGRVVITLWCHESDCRPFVYTLAVDIVPTAPPTALSATNKRDESQNCCSSAAYAMNSPCCAYACSVGGCCSAPSCRYRPACSICCAKGNALCTFDTSGCRCV